MSSVLRDLGNGRLKPRSFSRITNMECLSASQIGGCDSCNRMNEVGAGSLSRGALGGGPWRDTFPISCWLAVGLSLYSPSVR